MWRRTNILRGPEEDMPETVSMLNKSVYDQFASRPKPSQFTFRALTLTRLQGYIGAAGVLVASGFFLGPWLWDELQELFGNNFVTVDASEMPRMSPDWWENEWRKMNPVWRKGESMPNFFEGPYQFIEQQTGRDLHSAAAFVASAPSAGSILRPSRWSWWPWGRSTSASSSSSAPQVLVPLCGDSPILKTMVRQGYEVDGVDCSQTAIRTAVERTELGLDPALFRYVHLHHKDFFSPELWENVLHHKKYDIIYERQGMTSIERDRRADYAYLLKQALKEDGVLYVEGCFRTGRVKGNKVKGPPYSLSRAELEHLFPSSQGYFVRCEERTDAMKLLKREDKLLRRVPKELYVTPFHCVVFGEKAVNLEHREAAQKGAAAAAAATAATKL